MAEAFLEFLSSFVDENDPGFQRETIRNSNELKTEISETSTPQEDSSYRYPETDVASILYGLKNEMPRHNTSIPDVSHLDRPLIKEIGKYTF